MSVRQNPTKSSSIPHGMWVNLMAAANWASCHETLRQASRQGSHGSAHQALKQPGRYADGNGLYIVVDPSGAKRWILHTMVQGRRRDIGLGSLRLVSLGEAKPPVPIASSQGWRQPAR
jgi:hypothetical protein